MIFAATWVINSESNDAAKISVINTIQSAYNWATFLLNNPIISNILAITEDVDKIEVAKQVVLNTWVVSSNSTNIQDNTNNKKELFLQRDFCFFYYINFYKNI